MEKQIEEILSSGYKSPIEMIMGQMHMEIENGIYSAVQGYGINVDKEELIRALQYDRGQYEKGYADGLRHGETKWISVEERLPDNERQVLVYGMRGRICVCRYESRYDKHFRNLRVGFYRNEDKKLMNVRYWMSLPEPPKGA